MFRIFQYSYAVCIEDPFKDLQFESVRQVMQSSCTKQLE